MPAGKRRMGGEIYICAPTTGRTLRGSSLLSTLHPLSWPASTSTSPSARSAASTATSIPKPIRLANRTTSALSDANWRCEPVSLATSPWRRSTSAAAPPRNSVGKISEPSSEPLAGITPLRITANSPSRLTRTTSSPPPTSATSPQTSSSTASALACRASAMPTCAS